MTGFLQGGPACLALPSVCIRSCGWTHLVFGNLDQAPISSVPRSAHQAHSRTCSPPTAPDSSSTNLPCSRKLGNVNVSCNSRPQCPQLGLWPWQCPGGGRQDTLSESVSHSALFLWGRTLSWPLVAQVLGMFRTQLTQGPDRSWWTTTTHLES